MATSARIDDLRKKFDENPRRYFAPLANEYRKAGDLAQAIAISRQHLADQPGHMSGHIVFGQALFENKDYAEARTVFEAALALDPENLIALRHLGDIARDTGDYATARIWYQRVLDADPRNEDIAAQVALVAEAEANAAAAAASAAAAPSRTPLAATIITKAVTPRMSMASEAKTLEISAVPRPAPLAPQPEAEPPHPPLDLAPAFESAAPVPENMDDVAPPRMSLMGLDLETMANVEATPEADAMPAPRPSLGFDSGRFDGGLEEVEANPLAGLAGVAQNEESSASSLMGSTTPEPAMELETHFGSAATSPPPSAIDLPAELLVPSRNTPPVSDLGLAPQQPIETTGLWDTPDDVAEAEAAHAELDLDPAFAGTMPPPTLAAPVLDLETPVEAAPTATGAFATETMADLYVAQGYPEQAIDVYRQVLAQRPGDAGLLGKIEALEAAPASRTSGTVELAAVELAAVEPAAVEPAAVESAAVESAASAAVAPVAAAPADGPTIRDFFGAVARWRPARAEPAAAGYDLGIFAGAQISDADEHAARLIAALYPEPVGGSNGDGASHGEAAARSAAPEPASEPAPEHAARAATPEPAPSHASAESAPNRPSRRSSASFSFDQFFSQQSGGMPPRSATPSVSSAPVAPAAQSPEEIEQFQSWLGGLKKK